MKLSPHLIFNGQCEAAFKFYEQCFGGKIECLMTYASRPGEFPVPADWGDKILHASVAVAGQSLLGADVLPESYQKPQGFHVTVSSPAEVAEAERIFAALAENGTVQMPLQETFWAIRFGMVVDRFGIPWMVNCGRPV